MNRVEVLARLVEVHDHVVVRIIFCARCLPLQCAPVFRPAMLLLVEDLELAQLLLRPVGIPPYADGKRVMRCPDIDVTPKHTNHVPGPLHLVREWGRREEAILAVDVPQVLAPLGVRVESHIAHGIWAFHFHDAHRVPITLPLEQLTIWRGAQEAVREGPKSSWLHDHRLLPQIGVDCSSLRFRPPLDCLDIA